MQTIKTIGVVGSGLMGNGIAQVCAQSGFSVLLCDTNPAALEKAQKNIKSSLEKLTEKGKLTSAQKEETLARLRYVSSLQNFANVDYCIEAVTEKFEVKEQIFKTLDQVTKPEVILASNTSSIPIARLAAITKRPAKVIGMHFMNPVPLMVCVEVITGEKTDADTLQTVLDLTKKMGKTPVTVKDSPGFVVNRILMPLINEAAWTLYEGLATKEDIDVAMKLSCNFPMGPLTLADFVGLDTCLFILEVMHRDLKNDKFTPCPLFKTLVSQGKLGRKSGEGFYSYKH